MGDVVDLLQNRYDQRVKEGLYRYMKDCVCQLRMPNNLEPIEPGWLPIFNKVMDGTVDTKLLVFFEEVCEYVSIDLDFFKYVRFLDFFDKSF